MLHFEWTKVDKKCQNVLVIFGQTVLPDTFWLIFKHCEEYFFLEFFVQFLEKVL